MNATDISKPDFISAQNDIEALDTRMNSLRNLHNADTSMRNDLKQCRKNEQELNDIRKEAMKQVTYWREHGRLLAAKLALLESVRQHPMQTGQIQCENSCGATFSTEKNSIEHKQTCSLKRSVTIDETQNSTLFIDRLEPVTSVNVEQMSAKKRRRRNADHATLLDGTYWKL